MQPFYSPWPFPSNDLDTHTWLYHVYQNEVCQPAGVAEWIPIHSTCERFMTWALVSPELTLRIHYAQGTLNTNDRASILTLKPMGRVNQSPKQRVPVDPHLKHLKHFKLEMLSRLRTNCPLSTIQCSEDTCTVKIVIWDHPFCHRKVVLHDRWSLSRGTHPVVLSATNQNFSALYLLMIYIVQISSHFEIF